MAQIRTSRAYARWPDLDVSAFAGEVVAALTGNTNFPTPPVTPADLTTLKAAFDDAIVTAASGGPLQTALKDAARAALIAGLNKEASYVDINCNEDMAILLSSGFEPVSTNRSQVVLKAPVVLAAVNGPQSGKMQCTSGSRAIRIAERCRAAARRWAASSARRSPFAMRARSSSIA